MGGLLFSVPYTASGLEQAPVEYLLDMSLESGPGMPAVVLGVMKGAGKTIKWKHPLAMSSGEDIANAAYRFFYTEAVGRPPK